MGALASPVEAYFGSFPATYEDLSRVPMPAGGWPLTTGRTRSGLFDPLGGLRVPESEVLASLASHPMLFAQARGCVEVAGHLEEALPCARVTDDFHFCFCCRDSVVASDLSMICFSRSDSTYLTAVGQERQLNLDGTEPRVAIAVIDTLTLLGIASRAVSGRVAM